MILERDGNDFMFCFISGKGWKHIPYLETDSLQVRVRPGENECKCKLLVIFRHSFTMWLTIPCMGKDFKIKTDREIQVAVEAFLLFRFQLKIVDTCGVLSEGL